jgi:hypothetical protein
VDVAHALLGRRRHQALLLEHVAERFEAVLRQPAHAQRVERGAELAFLDTQQPAGLAGLLLDGADALRGERGDHLVGFALGQVGVQIDLARG